MAGRFSTSVIYPIRVVGSSGVTRDAADTIRFYALRMHEAGMIKSSPRKVIADGTDWRFLNELKRELKG